ncbi:hypothetical protein FB451DRAFT_164345 [Mycena latifolia]|nr:hypothetical protein FB451DRAFT_164345 [Mycena latifolia]
MQQIMQDIAKEEDLALKISSLQLMDRSELQVKRDTPPYPVLSLPPEIVSEIFEHFLPSCPDFAPAYGILSPLVLCRICRQWRQIALSTPTLWRSILITDSKSEDQLDLLKMWLARSGDCPLAIKLTGHPTYLLSSQYLQSAVVHCKRWERIELLMPLAELHLIQGEMPLLRDLTFGPTELSRDFPLISLFDHAPQLKRVRLTECFMPSAIRLPWAQLTHLEADCLYKYECMDILSHATSLVDCIVTVASSSETIEHPTALTLTHLRHLALLANDADTDIYLTDILDNLTLPALHTLRISAYGTNMLKTLKSFISRSHCTLEELRIEEESSQSSDSSQSSLGYAAYREAFPSIGSIKVFTVQSNTTYLPPYLPPTGT